MDPKSAAECRILRLAEKELKRRDELGKSDRIRAQWGQIGLGAGVDDGSSQAYQIKLRTAAGP
jgi:hypothetical protein